ncbi:MAG: PAS domain S-box protein [Syntrophobacteraceae bacterium]
MRVFSILLVGVALIFTVASPAHGKTVKVGVFDFKPLSHVHSEGEEDEGMFIALLRLVASKEKWTVELVPGSLSECLQRLNSGEIDLLAALTYSKEMSNYYDFTHETIISTWAQVYAVDKSHVQSWFDMASRSVGVVRDDPYGREIRTTLKRFDINCKFVEFEDYKSLLKALENKWIEIGIVDRLYGVLHEQAHFVEKTSFFFSPVELRFAAPKNTNSDLLAALDYHLGAMKKDLGSDYHQLISRILGKEGDFRAHRILAWSLLGALVLVCMLSGMSLLLRRQVGRKTAQLFQNYEELKNEVTMRRGAESALLENQKKYRALFEFAPEPVFVLTLEGRILDCNKAAEAITGYSKEALQETNIASLVSGGTTAGHSLTASQPRPAEHATELRFRRKSGELFPARVMTKSVELGEEKHLLVMVRDLTDEKKTEEELIKVQKLESIGVLAGGIAHDFNNILTAIMGNISLAAIQMDPREQATDRLAIAEQACLRAKDLIHQLLTFSRGGAPVKETASILSVIEESCRFALRGSNVKCEIEAAKDLWPAEIDVGQISQVINNIVINAQQAMPNGGKIRLGVSNRAVARTAELPIGPGNFIKISIQDQGAGIPKENLSKVFDPYFTTKAAGNGLGLASSYSIVKKHGGHIAVQSELGAGTTFQIHLPASSRPLQTTRHSEARVVTGRGRVLVMDDEEAIRELLQCTLKELNYEVELAADGSEAVRLYGQCKQAGSPIDLVIMDLTIPGGMGGKEAIGKLIEIDPHVKAIVSSGYSNDPIMSEYGRYGFSGVVLKPYRISELSRIIHGVISNSGRAEYGEKPATAA